MTAEETAKLIRELIDIGHKPIPDIDSASHFLDSSRARAKEIGELLHEVGGIGLLRQSHSVVRVVLGTYAARELEFAWDGVGEWQP